MTTSQYSALKDVISYWHVFVVREMATPKPRKKGTRKIEVESEDEVEEKEEGTEEATYNDEDQ